MRSGIVKKIITISTVLLVPVTVSLLGCTQQSPPIVSSSASPPASSASPTAASPSSVPAFAPSRHAAPTAALRVYIDPVTGAPRDPTPEELATEAATQRTAKKIATASGTSSAATSREVVMPNGIVKVPAHTTNRNALKGCIEKNGELKMDHDCDADTASGQSNNTKNRTSQNNGVSR